MRDARTIIADWISGFVGDDDPLGHWMPDADRLIGWLRDEGYAVTEMVPMVDYERPDQTDG